MACPAIEQPFWTATRLPISEWPKALRVSVERHPSRWDYKRSTRMMIDKCRCLRPSGQPNRSSSQAASMQHMPIGGQVACLKPDAVVWAECSRLQISTCRGPLHNCGLVPEKCRICPSLKLENSWGKYCNNSTLGRKPWHVQHCHATQDGDPPKRDTSRLAHHRALAGRKRKPMAIDFDLREVVASPLDSWNAAGLSSASMMLCHKTRLRPLRE